MLSIPSVIHYTDRFNLYISSEGYYVPLEDICSLLSISEKELIDFVGLKGLNEFNFGGKKQLFINEKALSQLSTKYNTDTLVDEYNKATGENINYFI